MNRLQAPRGRQAEGLKRTVSLIPARGGSKGVPRKNLTVVGGRPLIEYAIRASLDSSVDETWVSTEDPEIKSVALKLGALVIDRPVELALDTTSTEEVMLHFAGHVRFDHLVLLQCTCPFTISGDINSAIAMLGEYDSVLSVTRTHQFVWTEGIPNYDPKNRPRRQEAKETFLETGALFAITRDALFEHRCRLGAAIGFLEVPKNRSIDIDTWDDVQLVDRLLG